MVMLSCCNAFVRCSIFCSWLYNLHLHLVSLSLSLSLSCFSHSPFISSLFFVRTMGLCVCVCFLHSFTFQIFAFTKHTEHFHIRYSWLQCHKLHGIKLCLHHTVLFGFSNACKIKCMQKWIYRLCGDGHHVRMRWVLSIEQQQQQQQHAKLIE